MKITQICTCSILTLVGLVLLITGIIGGISYFKYSPDAPIYLGILLLSVSAVSWSINTSKPKEM
ncbi:hypothetical protein [Acidianus manzaensis]|uniref:Uncharacterized protein n=1 Tax=Acidianus manzaensis TaxID=282676 RepID=A0A1W6JYH3_9CREN|nr:hypothetical protein [Acidianus manzaensis]ARM75270.1 hypothetical protein B6F84_03975 [Acidianus manzaensis]